MKNWRLTPDEIVDIEFNAGNGGFFPYGVWGVLQGAAVCFYGFAGFDIISSSRDEVSGLTFLHFQLNETKTRWNKRYIHLMTLVQRYTFAITLFIIFCSIIFMILSKIVFSIQILVVISTIRSIFLSTVLKYPKTI